MLKIIGIPTEDRAIKLYNDWKQERDDWNKAAKRHDNILVWSTTIVCILLISMLLLCSCLWTFDAAYVNFMRVGIVLIVLIIGSFIIVVNLDGQWEYDNMSWPMQYKYYMATKDKTVLDSKLNNGMLELILENKNHEVENGLVLGFTEKIRTDIDEVTIDLHKAEILMPYSK